MEIQSLSQLCLHAQSTPGHLQKKLEGQPGSYFQVKYKCSLGVAFHSVSAYRTPVSNYRGYKACERIGHL